MAEKRRNEAGFISRGRKQNPLPSSALVAVALQDHITQQLSLSNHLPQIKKPSNIHGCRRCGKTTVSNVQTNRQMRPTKTDANHSARSSLPHSLTGGNHGARSRTKDMSSTKGHAPTSCGVGRGGKEYVLDTTPPPLTLAQRLGLTDAPPSLLTEQEWADLKISSNTRQDSALPCPICQEEFTLREQICKSLIQDHPLYHTEVLLSCSHVFHRTCLQSFERYSGKKQCPLCRRQDYQTRVIFEGAQQHRVRAAIRIQAAWRGYAVYKCYHELRERVPPKDPRLRKKHFENKLSSLTDRMVMSCDCSANGVESVLTQADLAVATSREAMRMLDSQLTETSIDWNTLKEKAKMEYNLVSTDCPVCLAPLQSDHLLTKPIAILSCGHLYHSVCIHALEQFSLAVVDLCPLCRAPYQRQML